MIERYRDEIPKWLRLLGAWRINKDSVDFTWGYFSPKPGLEFVLNRGTYFDQRWAIHFALGWGQFMVYLPFKTKLEGGCDMPKYGFTVHSDTLWIYKGGIYQNGQCQNQWWSWYLPYFSYEFDGHWIKDKTQTWVSMDNYKCWDFRKTDAYVETHPYTYTLANGEVQNRTAKCTVERRKWHRKWCPWLTTERQVIDIEFDDEVGEGFGSWKGGVTGCSYDMLPSETIESCLRRMEATRKFKR